MREQQQANAKKEPNDPGPSENNKTGEEDPPPVRIGRLEDRDGRGRWGKLPRTIIEEMYDNGRRKLPAKYRIHLEEYFRRLPEIRDQ